MKLYKNYTKEQFSFFVNDMTLLSDISLIGIAYYKITVSQKIKTIEQIKEKQSKSKGKYDLGRQNAKIFAYIIRKVYKLKLYQIIYKIILKLFYIQNYFTH